MAPTLPQHSESVAALLPERLRGVFSTDTLAVLHRLAITFADVRLHAAHEKAGIVRRARPRKAALRLPHPKARVHEYVRDEDGTLKKLEVFVLTRDADLIQRVRTEAEQIVPLPRIFSAGLGALWATVSSESTSRTIEYGSWPVLWLDRAHLVRIYGLKDKDHLKIEFSYYRQDDGQRVATPELFDGIALLMESVLGKRPRLLDVTPALHPVRYASIQELLVT